MDNPRPSTEIGGLADLDLPALRRRWHELYGSDAPVRMSREVLVQAVAYRIQERTLGGLSRAARLQLATIEHAAPEGAKVRQGRSHHRIKAGTRFLRQWQGETHEVTATAEGAFLYRGACYRSLSQIARRITGTCWSGPAFFGLRGQQTGEADVA